MLAGAVLYAACVGSARAATPEAAPPFVLTSGITKPDLADPLSTFVGKPRWDDAQSLASYCVSDVAGRSIELASLTGSDGPPASSTSTPTPAVSPATVSSKARDLAAQYDICSLRVLGNGPVAAFAQFRAAEAYLIAADYGSDASQRKADLTLAIARAQRAEELQRYFQIETKLDLVRLETGGSASITGVLVKPWTDAIVAYAKKAIAEPSGRRYDL